LELGSSIHLPFDEPIFDYYPLAENGKTKDILLFAAPERYVMEYSDLLSSLKLQPVVADISPLALYRLYHQLDQASQNEVLFTVQFDLTSVNLCIFEESVPLVMRQFPLPFVVDNWDINYGNDGSMDCKYTGDPEELVIQFEDFLKEISKLLDFYKYSLSKEKRDVTKFLLNGDHPMLNAIFEEMTDRFDVPVSRITLETEAKGKVGNLPTNLLLSLGLALKEVK
jgi:type IV pilus assembly protein PilM